MYSAGLSFRRAPEADLNDSTRRCGTAEIRCFCCFRCFRRCYLPAVFRCYPAASIAKSEGFRGQSECRWFSGCIISDISERVALSRIVRPVRCHRRRLRGISNKTSSWICRSMRAFRPASAKAAEMGPIARLMVSAAEPCRGALIAWRWIGAKAGDRRYNSGNRSLLSQEAAK